MYFIFINILVFGLFKIFICFLEELGEEILSNLSRDRETMTKTRDRVRNICKFNHCNGL